MFFSFYSTGAPRLGKLEINSGIYITQVKSINYLGVTVDQSLKWDEDVKNRTKRIKGLLFKFKYLRAHLNNNYQIVSVYFLQLLSVSPIGQISESFLI